MFLHMFSRMAAQKISHTAISKVVPQNLTTEISGTVPGVAARAPGSFCSGAFGFGLGWRVM